MVGGHSEAGPKCILKLFQNSAVSFGPSTPGAKNQQKNGQDQDEEELKHNDQLLTAIEAG